MKKHETDEQVAKRLKEVSDYNIKSSLQYCPEPTYFFKIGDTLPMNGTSALIVDVLYEGKVYLVRHQQKELDDVGRYARIVTVETYYFWYNLRPTVEETETLQRNRDCRLYFSNRTISDIFTRAYHFGLNLDPEYQRGYVWTQEDKEKLIDSIFGNIDIGKFCYIKKKYSDEYLYEVLDGKQRCRAILDYYENRFPYKGKYYNDLSNNDKWYFDNYMISVAEIDYADKQTVLKYFLLLNTAGKVMDKEHLAKVYQMYLEENHSK